MVMRLSREMYQELGTLFVGERISSLIPALMAHGSQMSAILVPTNRMPSSDF